MERGFMCGGIDHDPPKLKRRQPLSFMVKPAGRVRVGLFDVRRSSGRSDVPSGETL
jgi:hypothetical protein